MATWRSRPLTLHGLLAWQDMTSLTFLHEPGVLWNLQQRYSRSVVYTRTGGILIAINPFAPLPHLYGPAVMQRYAGLEPLETAPHPYAIANAAYTKMRREGKGQAILVSSSRQQQQATSSSSSSNHGGTWLWSSSSSSQSETELALAAHMQRHILPVQWHGGSRLQLEV